MNTVLIREAEMLTSGAEIHTTRELVSWYRARMDDSPRIATCLEQAEEALKKHVKMLRARRFR